MPHFFKMSKKEKKTKKKKKNSYGFLAWLLFLCLLIGGAYWGYKYLKSPVSQPIEAIPNDAFFVFEANNPESFLDALNYDNLLWNGLKKSTKIKKIDRNIKKLDSLLTFNDDLWDVLEENSCYFSLHSVEKDVESLYIIGLGNAHKKNSVNRFVEDFFSHKAEIVENSHEQTLYYTVSQNDTKFFYAVSNGVFIATKSLPLLKKSLDQLQKKTGLIALEDFNEIKSTCGKKVDANVYISHQHLRSSSKNNAQNAPFSIFNNIENLSLMTGLDMYVKSESWLLNGYSSIADANILTLFQAQQSVENHGIMLLPKETQAFLKLGFTDAELFYDNLLKNHSNTNILNSINQKYSVSLIDDFAQFSNNEIYFAWLNNEPLLLMQLSDIESATLLMLKLSDRNFEYHAGNIVDLNSTAFCNAVFGTDIFNIKPKKWCIFGEYLILGETDHAILKILESKRNITESTAYQAMAENITDHSNGMFYCNFSNADVFMQKNCSKKLFNIYKKNKELVSDFNGICVQFSASSGLFYTNVVISYRSDAAPISNPEDSSTMAQTDESHDVTENLQDQTPFVETESQESVKKEEKEEKGKTVLQGKMILKPFPVRDHSTNENKFLVFDDKKNVYLIDKNGKIAWTKLVHDQPISDVFEIDFYANGKIQYLFNSKQYIYIIDLKGNWVSGYPLKIKDGIQNPMVLLDYKKNRDYRFLFVDNKGVVQNYSKDGVSISGWTKPVLQQKISNPAKLCMKGDEKYLIFPMDNGNVLMTNQLGATRMKIEKSFVNNTRSDFYINRTNSKGVLLTTDKKGDLIYIPEKGNVKKTTFGTFSDKHFFLYLDFNGDGSNDFIYLDGKKLQVFDRLQNLLLTYSFPSSPNVKPDIYSVDKQHYLCVFVASEKKAYIFSKKGLLTTLSCTTPPSISKVGKNEKILLLTGNGNELQIVDFETAVKE